MNDFLSILARLAPRRRRRVSRAICGPAAESPNPDFLKALASELDAAGFSPGAAPVFFAAELELDAVYAAAGAAGRADSLETIYDDRRGMMEMDGLCLDAVLVYEAPDGVAELVLVYAKLGGKWSGRRFRRLCVRLGRVFGERGDAFPSIRPRFVALGPDRPGPAQTASWPSWMRRGDGASLWLPFGKAADELSVARCDKRGRPRRIGEHWRFDPVKAKKA